MSNTFHKNTYYRVKQKTDRQGAARFIVQSANSLLDVIFGSWDDYQKENFTLEEAISQIEAIDKYRLKKEKIVHFEKRP
jgi:hypothetical protein